MQLLTCCEASEEAKKERGKKSTVKQDISFTIKELEWFSRTSYNLSLRSIEEWPLTTSIRIVSTCLKVFLVFYLLASIITDCDFTSSWNYIQMILMHPPMEPSP